MKGKKAQKLLKLSRRMQN